MLFAFKARVLCLAVALRSPMIGVLRSVVRLDKKRGEHDDYNDYLCVRVCVPIWCGIARGDSYRRLASDYQRFLSLHVVLYNDCYRCMERERARGRKGKKERRGVAKCVINQAG